MKTKLLIGLLAVLFSEVSIAQTWLASQDGKVGRLWEMKGDGIVVVKTSEADFFEASIFDLGIQTLQIGNVRVGGPVMDYQCSAGIVLKLFTNGVLIASYPKFNKTFTLRLNREIAMSTAYPNRLLECPLEDRISLTVASPDGKVGSFSPFDETVGTVRTDDGKSLQLPYKDIAFELTEYEGVHLGHRLSDGKGFPTAVRIFSNGIVQYQYSQDSGILTGRIKDGVAQPL